MLIFRKKYFYINFIFYYKYYFDVLDFLFALNSIMSLAKAIVMHYQIIYLLKFICK